MAAGRRLLSGKAGTVEIEIQETGFDGLKIVRCGRFVDHRGVFLKPWTEQIKPVFGEICEVYFSSSDAGVLRGLHYQLGEAAQAKYVMCLAGAVEDIALDIRPESPTYGRVFRMRLDAMSGEGVIVPEGFAHGVYAHQPSVIVNFCNKKYAPGVERGVYWGSLPELADLDVRVVSEKDAGLPPWRADR